jgi:hypothetical protein
MRFDDSGYLTLGDRNRIEGGSATAREMLISITDGSRIFELEAHDYSRDVAFACLGAEITYSDFPTGLRIEARTVQLDFSDFTQLRGDWEAMKAFDIGFAILHELAHGALQLKDAVSYITQLGACEEHINLIRRELGLPERLHYAPRFHTIQRFTGTTKLAELIFVRVSREAGREKARKFCLWWNAESVTIGDTQNDK